MPLLVSYIAKGSRPGPTSQVVCHKISTFNVGVLIETASNIYINKMLYKQVKVQ